MSRLPPLLHQERTVTWGRLGGDGKGNLSTLMLCCIALYHTLDSVCTQRRWRVAAFPYSTLDQY